MRYKLTIDYYKTDDDFELLEIGIENKKLDKYEQKLLTDYENGHKEYTVNELIRLDCLKEDISEDLSTILSNQKEFISIFNIQYLPKGEYNLEINTLISVEYGISSTIDGTEYTTEVMYYPKSTKINKI